MNGAAPTVSVLLPVRDGAATLAQALASIAAQTLADHEVVAVDDGSTDETPAILRTAAAADPRIRVVTTAPSGIAAALREGLALCRAPLVARADADDLSHPERLAEQARFLDARPEIELCGTHVEILGLGDEAAGRGMTRHAAWLDGIREPSDVARELWVECPILHPTFCFRRETVSQLGGYRSGPFPEDYELVLRLAEAGRGMANVARRLVVWRDWPRRASRRLDAYSRPAFFRLKAEALARGRLAGRPAIVWGAGKVGRFLSRELLARGAEVTAFVDIDPKKHGRTVRGRTVIPPDALGSALLATPTPLVIGAVGSLGARELIRAALTAQGLREPIDFVMAA